jgi:nucleotide-binding universal stress UspA family protein
MNWKSIVVGVDESPETVAAAMAAAEWAKQLGAECHLVHVTADVDHIPVVFPASFDLADLNRRLTDTARETLTRALRTEIPQHLVDTLDVRTGNPALALPEAVRDYDGDLLVIGGKHHAAPMRWFGGSTAHHLLRTVDTPMLVTDPGYGVVDQILVAADLSHAAGDVIECGAGLADAFDAKLTLLHAIEPVPYLADYPSLLDHDAYVQWSEERFKGLVARHCPTPHPKLVLREGDPVEIAMTLVRQTDADLLVLGSHGKGWVDRLLVGSTATGLLNRLPTSMLVLPVGQPSAAAAPGTDHSSARQSE